MTLFSGIPPFFVDLSISSVRSVTAHSELHSHQTHSHLITRFVHTVGTPPTIVPQTAVASLKYSDSEPESTAIRIFGPHRASKLSTVWCGFSCHAGLARRPNHSVTVFSYHETMGSE